MLPYNAASGPHRDRIPSGAPRTGEVPGMSWFLFIVLMTILLLVLLIPWA